MIALTHRSNARQAPHTTKRLLLFSICLAAGVCFALHTQPACAQYDPPLRTFVVDGVHSNDPVQIVGFRVNGRVVKPGTQFQASEEDWLKDSTVIVKNVSPREVTGIWVNLFFPEIDNGAATAADQVQVGNRAASETKTRTGTPVHDNDYPAFSLKPGQSYELSLGTNYEASEAHRQHLKPGVTAKRCMVRFAAAYFRNGMKWAPGYFAKPDLDRPGEFIRISPIEFWRSEKTTD